MENKYNQEQRIKIKMEDFRSKVEAILGEHSIIAFDFFYVRDYHQYMSKSFSLSPDYYVNQILLPFINEFGSLGNNADFKMEHKNYQSCTGCIEPYDLTFSKSENITKKSKVSTFEDMFDHLKNIRFGNSCFWMNSNTKHINGGINTSLFLIFQKRLGKKEVGQLINFIFKDFIHEITTVIVEEWVEVIEKERIEKEIHRKFNREILEAHSHTIFNCIPTLEVENLRDKFSPLIENAEEYELGYLLGIDSDLKMLQIRLNELNYVTHAALESPSSNKDKLFQEKRLNEIIEILKILTSGRCEPNIVGFESIKYNPVFKNKECQNAFTILWNAWNNAIKHSPDKKIDLCFWENGQYLHLKFSNKYVGSLSTTNIEMLRNEHEPALYNAGVPIIKHLCNSLGWQTWADEDSLNKKFSIEFKINKQL